MDETIFILADVAAAAATHIITCERYPGGQCGQSFFGDDADAIRAALVAEGIVFTEYTHEEADEAGFFEHA